MILLNARSIRNKLPEFRCLVATETVDIIAVTESWIHTGGNDFEAEFELPGYTMFKKDRIGRQGGGVLLYARSHLQATCHTINSAHELIGVEINGANLRLNIYLVYRPPHQTVDRDTELYSLLSRLIHNKIAVIAGDFNCNVNWETLTSGVEGNRLIDFSNENYLTQVVEEPTRGNNILDLIFTSEEDLISNVTVGECLGTSDHCIVKCKLGVQTTPEQPNVRRKLNFRAANFDRFRRDLNELPHPVIGDIEDVWNSFKSSFMEIQTACIPLKSVGGTAKVNPKWFTREIASAIADRKHAYELLKTQPTPDREEALTNLRRVVKRLTRTAKRDEEHRVAAACKQNPKEFFDYVNSRKPIKASIGPLTSDQGNTLTSNADIAEEFHKFFISVYTEENDEDIPQPVILYNGEHPLDTIECSTDEIRDKIVKLKANKSPGPDGFLPRVIKAVTEELAPHLQMIFNRSLELGMVPEDMKVANVTPIYKKGPKDIPGNYRPISLTSVIGKLLESVITDRIVDHLEDNNLLGNSQHGFRRKRSCLTNLLEFFHHMIAVYDNSRAIDVIYLDFKKAFDKVPHKRLLSKLRALGVGGTVAGWIECWLSERKQRVVINGANSQWSSVTSGVPQGSVLGPLLFLIYINDLDSGLVSKISKFADDTKLGANAADPDAVRNLQLDLDKIGEWSEKWLMPFNTDKCKVMHIGYANPSANYTLLGSQMATTNLEKDLGVYISSDLKFSTQCIEVEKRAQKLLGYICRQFKYRDKVIVLTLYNALVRPILEYAVQFWSPTLAKDIVRLEKVQARATKLIPAIRNKGYQRRLKDLNLFTLEKRRLRGQLIETFKILKGFNNIDHRNLFTLSENPTRNNGWKIQLERYNLKPFQDFMTNRICNVWNRLPANVVNSGTVDTFKRRLDRILPNLNY
jgi:hypothetical protein